MKRTLLMRLCPFVLTVLLLLTGLTASKAQSSSPFFQDNTYFDTDYFIMEIEKKMIDLLKSSTNYLETSTALIQLKDKKSAVVEIKKITPFDKIISSRDLAHQLRKSTVLFGVAFDVENNDQIHVNPATGYIIDEDGIVVTNHHVVESFTFAEGVSKLAMGIATDEGKVYLVTELLSTNQDNDLCIVRVDTRGDKLTALPIGMPAQQGDEVFVMSHPVEMLYYFSKGVVARNHIAKDDDSSAMYVRTMDITADYAAGSSGGPIVDQFGNLVSTVSSTESIIYPNEDQQLQMVVKRTKPVVLLQEMIKLK